MTAVDFAYVAFGSITEAAAQVAGGHLDTYTGTPEMIPLVRGGQLRMVASASVDRWPEFPEVPTLRERGFDTATRQLIGFAGPAGLPPAVRERRAPADEPGRSASPRCARCGPASSARCRRPG